MVLRVKQKRFIYTSLKFNEYNDRSLNKISKTLGKFWTIMWNNQPKDLTCESITSKVKQTDEIIYFAIFTQTSTSWTTKCYP